jgi:type IV pilus assembly protein PilW
MNRLRRRHGLRHAYRLHRFQQGLSVVELMVGIAIGLVVAAAALSLLARHLHENRSLLVEARLLQDLRTTTDLMARDLRRAGYWGHAAQAIWRESATPQANPHATLSAQDTVRFSYSRETADDADDNAVDTPEAFGYRLQNGAIEMQLGAGGWQAMTDPGTMTVVGLSVTPQLTEISLEGACPRPCASGSSACPPRQQVRSVAVQIDVRSTTQPPLLRSTQARVRLRNDAIVGACSP